ncbi:RNA 2',3'-cyclic phosphodiesterase [Spirochaetota bacterium]
MKRLFVGLPVSIEVKKALQNTSDYLKQFDSILKIVPPKNYHITLKFLGKTDGDVYKKIHEDFSELDFGIPPINISIKGLGAFPRVNNATVIWSGLRTDESMNTLFNSVENFFTKHGYKKENRKFNPHLTLARVRNKKKIPRELVDHIIKNSETDYIDSAFQEIVLFESELTSGGPKYIRLFTKNLV